MKKNKLRKKLEKIKVEYWNLHDGLLVIKASGDVARLCNLRSEFDESFDAFFDNEELRKKYDAWDEDENAINLNITTAELERRFYKKDLERLINYYQELIWKLKEEIEDTKIAGVIKEIQSLYYNTPSNQRITDADTILADLTISADMTDESGLGIEVLGLWSQAETRHEKASIKAMFYIFTGIYFTDYLKTCMEETTHTDSAEDC